jgi:hypothetical protein
LKIVDDFNNIQAAQVPMDNLGGYFIKRDGTEIQVRRWMPNGQIAITSYIPQFDNDTTNTSSDEIKSQNEPNMNFTKAFEERLDSIIDRLDTLEDIISNPKPKRATKKEVSSDE